MRSNRSIKNRGRRKKAAASDIDITSLLDILVTLLFFLISSFNTSGVVVNVPEGIVLPSSQSISPNEPGVIVQVSADKIWVDEKLIVDQTADPKVVMDHGGRRIVPLYDELSQKRESAKLIEKSAPAAKPFQGVLNLVLDRDLKYSMVKKVLYTSAEAGYLKYKFIVLGEEQ